MLWCTLVEISFCFLFVQFGKFSVNKCSLSTPIHWRELYLILGLSKLSHNSVMLFSFFLFSLYPSFWIITDHFYCISHLVCFYSRHSFISGSLIWAFFTSSMSILHLMLLSAISELWNIVIKTFLCPCPLILLHMCFYLALILALSCFLIHMYWRLSGKPL